MATESLKVAPSPCDTCPYARSTPSGVWDPSEYRKLEGYDRDPCVLPAFLCHNGEREFVCRGWLGTHRFSVAVRLAILRRQLKPEDVPTEDDPSLYPSGTAACRAGLKGTRRPTRKAKRAIEKIRVARFRTARTRAKKDREKR